MQNERRRFPAFSAWESGRFKLVILAKSSSSEIHQQSRKVDSLSFLTSLRPYFLMLCAKREPVSKDALPDLYLYQNAFKASAAQVRILLVRKSFTFSKARSWLIDQAKPFLKWWSLERMGYRRSFGAFRPHEWRLKILDTNSKINIKLGMASVLRGEVSWKYKPA